MGSKKTRKEKIMAQKRQQKLKEAELLEFLRNYGEAEPPQEIAKALFDNQIKSIFTSLAEIIDKSNAGTMIDAGCGNGTILSRLADLQIFAEKTEWSYLGIDYQEYKIPVISLAAEAGLHRKVDFLSLDDFYRQWPNYRQLSRPHFVFSRNVLHELDIEKTTILLSHIVQNLAPEEKLIVQDLLVFPKAEKGNVCWELDSLKSLLEDIGFTSYLTVEQSKYGGRWVNVIATRNDLTALDFSTINSTLSHCNVTC
jgi:SAM-dependent methyltransferase